jgi:hypothetical protein
MIKVLSKEYTKRGIAYHEHVVSLFGIPLFKRIDTTSNTDVVNNLKKYSIKEVKGFRP